MWYEILPGMAVVYVCLTIPGVATAYIQKFTNGGKERRVIRSSWQWLLLERDKKVSDTGHHFDSKGLENIK